MQVRRETIVPGVSAAERRMYQHCCPYRSDAHTLICTVRPICLCGDNVLLIWTMDVSKHGLPLLLYSDGCSSLTTQCNDMLIILHIFLHQGGDVCASIGLLVYPSASRITGLQKIICGTVNTLHDNLPDLHLAMELTSLSTLGQGNNEGF